MRIRGSVLGKGQMYTSLPKRAPNAGPSRHAEAILVYRDWLVTQQDTDDGQKKKHTHIYTCAHKVSAGNSFGASFRHITNMWASDTSMLVCQ